MASHNAEFFVNVHGDDAHRWSWETLVSVGNSGEAVVKLSDSIDTYATEDEAWVAGEQHLATTLRDAVVAALAPRR